jgi:hypothetical protein
MHEDLAGETSLIPYFVPLQIRKRKFLLFHAKKACRRSRGTTPLILKLGTKLRLVGTFTKLRLVGTG